jgi:hypothetical protein
VSKKDRRRKKKKKGGSKGGRLSGMRSGMKSFVGTGPKKKESTLSKVITFVLIAAAVGLLIYRFTR